MVRPFHFLVTKVNLHQSAET
uniref:Uncharacterized protein n=1 Tax=Steinernema glaseri TaxID=37863 RepID=A0A1I7XZ14_9BILA